MQMDVLEAEERDKYRRMWAQPAYRRYSPGAEAVPWFLANADINANETIVDAGCGTGRAGLALHRAALDLRVYLLDFCREAVERESFDLPFIEACLWNLPKWMMFDWIFCADTMEHIPTEKVDDVLDCLQRATWKGGMFQIALGPDGCGQLIGETLHLTVMEPEWWHDKITKRWDITKIDWINVRGLGRYQVVFGAPH